MLQDPSINIPARNLFLCPEAVQFVRLLLLSIFAQCSDVLMLLYWFQDVPEPINEEPCIGTWSMSCGQLLQRLVVCSAVTSQLDDM